MYMYILRGSHISLCWFSCRTAVLYLGQIGIWSKCPGFCGRRKTGENQKKNPQGKVRTDDTL